VLESTRVHLQQVHKEAAVSILVDEEDVVADELSDQVPSEFGRDLKGVHSEREENFDDVFNVTFTLAPDYSVLVLL